MEGLGGSGGEACDAARESLWHETERGRAAGVRGAGREAQLDAERADPRVILASQLAYSSPHHKVNSEAYRALFITDIINHIIGMRLSLSNMEHTKTATCNSLRQVNIGQLLIE
jgi:hypothetical protein